MSIAATAAPISLPTTLVGIGYGPDDNNPGAPISKRLAVFNLAAAGSNEHVVRSTGLPYGTGGDPGGPLIDNSSVIQFRRHSAQLSVQPPASDGPPSMLPTSPVPASAAPASSREMPVFPALPPTAGRGSGLAP